ncbi:uncharacterized protein LOC129742036 [Uranotaenia lowii]|uniref:uncharacterized protein LOC129742036 n=1 Tax=Uranotaenia lowii TaxID=190385 RepID=UPI00247AEF09|nr:uncharacterized protein LOC129742036 [Uranotaenia lowii]
MPAASKKVAPVPLEVLTTKYNVIRCNFNDIWRFVEKFNEDCSASSIEVRLEKLDGLWESFNETIIAIISHEEYCAQDDAYENERLEFSDKFYHAKSFLMEKMKMKQELSGHDQSARANETVAHHSLDHVRLPQIKLQTFNGDIDEWLSFRDLFTSLIHWKTDLPEVEKFHYLKGCLQGEPKNLIDSLQITRANYQIAWDTLLRRYNNNKHLKKRQVLSLFILPTLNKENASELHLLFESFERIIQTLDQIVQPTEYKDLLLVNLLTSRLDSTTRRGWEEQSSSNEQDTIKELLEFLQRRIRVLEALPTKQTEPRGPQQVNNPSRPRLLPRISHNAVQFSGKQCVACNAHHPLYTCSTFQRLKVADREALIRSHALCRNCFRSGHQAKDCQSKFSCRYCKARHHSMVCFKSDGEARQASREQPRRREEAEGLHVIQNQTANLAASDSTANTASQRFSSQVQLATAVILLQDDEGNQFPARALLDSGSESNFLSERMNQLLQVPRQKVEISILGIGQTGTRVRQKVNAIVRSRTTDFKRTMSFLVLPKVTVNLPTANVNTQGWNFPEGIELADPTFCFSSSVDVVLGIEAFFDFFSTGRKLSLGDNLPSLNESVFGWVISGGNSNPSQPLRINCNVSTTENLDALISRFWSSEEIEFPNNYSPEESRCEEMFCKTIVREPGGRYCVGLPKDESKLKTLGESREIALRRLYATERRLARDEELHKQYAMFMREYEEMGHMKKVETHAAVKRCYLPHHPVIKSSSTTTKLRVVFDASCKTASGISLNDTLLVGPVVQQDLRSIILRSRTRQFMLVSDIEKMFRQINILSEDKPLQSILWRESPLEEVSTYELNTVTYGTKPAPFLATRTLQWLAEDEQHTYPLAAKALREDTYMDDVISGADTVEEATILRKQLVDLTACGGFRLRKHASNCLEALVGLSDDDLAIRIEKGIILDPDPSVNTLGLTWLPITDELRFRFEIPAIESNDILTKRRVLSIIATLFDPLGLIGATIVKAKIFMQLLWTLKNNQDECLGWDEPLPSTVGEEWKWFHSQLPLLNQLRINRCVIIPNAVNVEIHCFSDASQKAYGTCLYLRSTNAEGQTLTRILTSKSRVSPLRCQSIPRLELAGALHAAELYDKVKHALNLNASTYFWTDSTCVWRWLQATPSTWSTYVANRVAKIQNLTEGCEWRHVPGSDNPADLISRGITPDELMYNRLWWNGPPWLEKEAENWPKSMDVRSEEGDEERRRTAHAAACAQKGDFNEFFIAKFSSYNELLRSTAIWLRLINILRKSTQQTVRGPLTLGELKEAEIRIIRSVQQESFAEELKTLTKDGTVLRSSKLRWFHPFVSESGLIRIGGRLSKSEEAEDSKHPIVLPARHRLTRMILEQYHLRLLHAGPQLMLSNIRLRFWPLGGRNIVKQIVHQCHKCFRAKPKPVQQFMGDLPASRVTISRPFSKTGVDYFGPIYIRPGPRRTATKAYVAIFICLCTKAVHMELVSDLSTDRFLQALRRFIGRRSMCSDLFSDNGTNFVGARNKMREFLQQLKSQQHRDHITKFCDSEGINWHFNPPGGPHFGGLWEAAVRSAKHHMLRVIGDTPKSIEDMQTLLVQIEACLNSRPITPLSDDPNDLEALTPGHFLVGSSLRAPPEPDHDGIPINRLNYWQQIQQQRKQFWIRWKREYLCQLQARVKRWRPSTPIAVDELVIICDDNKQPIHWKMGRIVKVHPGEDGVIRVVTIRTANGLLTRPIERVCILPKFEETGHPTPSEESKQIQP